MKTAGSAPRLGRGVGAAGLSLFVTFLLVYGPALLPALRSPREMLAVRLLSVLIVVLVARLGLARILGCSLADLGLSVSGRTLVRAAVGLGVGALAITLAFCVAWGAGGLVVVPGAAGDGAGQIFFDVTLFAVSALFEELCFRMGLVGILRRVIPPPIALGTSAAVFGLLHATNPGATTTAVLNTMLAGLALGLLFLERKGQPLVPSLGLCTGFHFAWNAMQSDFYGVPVSGYPAHSRVLATEAVDLAWSGGSYGLEAGYGATLALGLLCVWAARKADLRSP